MSKPYSRELQCHLFYEKHAFIHYGLSRKYKYKILKALLLRNRSYAFFAYFLITSTRFPMQIIYFISKIQQLKLKLETDLKSLPPSSFFRHLPAICDILSKAVYGLHFLFGSQKFLLKLSSQQNYCVHFLKNFLNFIEILFICLLTFSYENRG